MAVFNYDQRWTEVLRDAGTKEIVLYFPDLKSANNLRQKLYRLRLDMKKENHEFYKLASRVSANTIMIFRDGREVSFVNHTRTPIPDAKELQIYDKRAKLAPFILRLRPHDLRYEEVLEDAGYILPDQPDLG